MNPILNIIVLTICLSQLVTTANAAAAVTLDIDIVNRQSDGETDMVVSSELENLVSRQKRMLFFRPLLQYKEEIVKETHLREAEQQEQHIDRASSDDDGDDDGQ